jgi:hypothetical protein
MTTDPTTHQAQHQHQLPLFPASDPTEAEAPAPSRRPALPLVEVSEEDAAVLGDAMALLVDQLAPRPDRPSWALARGRADGCRRMLERGERRVAPHHAVLMADLVGYVDWTEVPDDDGHERQAATDAARVRLYAPAWALAPESARQHDVDKEVRGD